MKHLNKFNEFMKNTVNINQSRIDTLTNRVDVIDRFLKDDPVFGDLYIETISQGSYSHRTIIKPSLKKPEFDADLVFHVKENDDWEPKDYIENLYAQLRNNSNYKNIVGRGTRCVTLDYSGEFHLDIVPCINRDEFWSGETFHICNRNENAEEQTDPQGYTGWLRDKNKSVGNNNLIKSIRLFKFLRDIKQTFSCKSILLATLIAEQTGGLRDMISPYDDLPTTLKTLFNRLDDYLQDNEEMPIIENPVNEEEDFNRHWTQEKYDNFRNQINKYNLWLNEAFDEEEQSDSVTKWKKIFGDDFSKSTEEKSSSAKLSASHFPVPDHAAKPPWSILKFSRAEIRVTVHVDGDESNIVSTISRENIGPKVPKRCKVRMEYLGQVSHTHEIHWQVVNTGKDAASRKDGLRGGFYKDGPIRTEETLYEGVHYIECFIVDKKKKICTASSGKYFINIE